MTYYSKEITLPTTKRDGLENFLQIIINKLEAGDKNEALLATVDLLHDVQCGAYDDAMADSKGRDLLGKEIQAKHTAEIIKTAEVNYERGVSDEKARMAKALKLVA